MKNTYQIYVETIVLYVHEQSEILELSFNKNQSKKKKRFVSYNSSMFSVFIITTLLLISGSKQYFGWICNN